MTLLGVVPLPIYSIVYACSGQVIFIKQLFLSKQKRRQSNQIPASGTIIAVQSMLVVPASTVVEL